jgi:hypothetical protein
MAPDVVRRGVTGPLKPGVLIRGVVEHQFGDHLQPAPVRGLQEDLEVMQGTIRRMDIRVVRDIIPVIFEGGRVEGEQPEGRDPQVVQIPQLLRQPREIPYPVAVAVIKGADVQFINNRILIP